MKAFSFFLFFLSLSQKAFSFYVFGWDFFPAAF